MCWILSVYFNQSSFILSPFFLKSKLHYYISLSFLLQDIGLLICICLNSSAIHVSFNKLVAVNKGLTFIGMLVVSMPVYQICLVFCPTY